MSKLKLEIKPTRCLKLFPPLPIKIVSNSAFFLNKKLEWSKTSNLLLFPFPEKEGEAEFYFYFHCSNGRYLWNHLKLYFVEDSTLPSQSLQAAVCSFFRRDSENKVYFITIFIYFVNLAYVIVSKNVCDCYQPRDKNIVQNRACHAFSSKSSQY